MTEMIKHEERSKSVAKMNPGKKRQKDPVMDENCDNPVVFNYGRSNRTGNRKRISTLLKLDTRIFDYDYEPFGVIETEFKSFISFSIAFLLFLRLKRKFSNSESPIRKIGKVDGHYVT